MDKQGAIKHKEIIQKYLDNPNLVIQVLHNIDWVDVSNPTFDSLRDYRIDPVESPFKVGNEVLFIDAWTKDSPVFNEDFNKVLGDVGIVVDVKRDRCLVKFENFTWSTWSTDNDSFYIPNECLKLAKYEPFSFDDGLVGSVLINKNTKVKRLVLGQGTASIETICAIITYKQLLEEYVFETGKKCGKLKQ